MLQMALIKNQPVNDEHQTSRSDHMAFVIAECNR